MRSWLCIGVALVRSSTGPPNSARAFVRWNDKLGADISVNLDASIDLFQRSARRSSWGCWRREEDHRVLDAILVALSHHRAPEAIGPASRFRHHADPEVRLGVVFALMGYENQEAARRPHRTDERRRCPGAGLGTLHSGHNVRRIRQRFVMPLRIGSPTPMTRPAARRWSDWPVVGTDGYSQPFTKNSPASRSVRL